MGRVRNVLAVGLMLAAGYSQSGAVVPDHPGRIRIAARSANASRWEYTAGTLQGKLRSAEGRTFLHLSFPGGFHTTGAGAPAFPVDSRLLILPEAEGVSVGIQSIRWEQISLPERNWDYPLWPTQPSLRKDLDPSTQPFVWDSTVIRQKAWIGDSLVSVSFLGHLRDQAVYRLEIKPVQWNPASRQLRLAREITFDITYPQADWAATADLRTRLASPLFTHPLPDMIDLRDAGAERDAYFNDRPHIVLLCPEDFYPAMEPWIAWKERQGYTVTTGIPGQNGLGSTPAELRSWITDLYNGGTADLPAPSFVVLVGDNGDLPSFNGTTGNHKSDLYYGEVTGDFLPDLYVGRLSGNSPEQIQAIVTKTMVYEMQTLADPSYQTEVTMIGGVDSYYGSSHANGQINYGVSLYFNQAHNILSHTYLYPGSGSAESAILATMNSGIGYINYTAHGSEYSWADPTVTLANVHDLTNSQKYFTAVANACLTAKFDVGECIGEAFLRQPDGGAIGYIGGSDNTYWDEDYYWAVGFGPIVGDGATYEQTGLGAYDGMFHDHGEGFATWCTVNGAILLRGNLAVASSGSAQENYYWEIYHLLGDPTLSTNLGAPTAQECSYPTVIQVGTTDFTVTGDPYALVSLHDSDHALVSGCLFADGERTFSLADETLVPGPLELVITAQNRLPVLDTIQVIAPDTPYLTAGEPLCDDSLAWHPDGQVDMDETLQLRFRIRNRGQVPSAPVSVHLESADSYVTLIPDTLAVAPLVPDSAVWTGPYSLEVSGSCPDGHDLRLNAVMIDTFGTTWTSTLLLTVHAPRLQLAGFQIQDANNGRLDINETVDLLLELTNDGSCEALACTTRLSTLDPYLALPVQEAMSDSVPVDSTVRPLFTIRALPTTPPGHLFRIQWQITGDHAYQDQGMIQIPAGLIIEDFESGDFSAFDWIFSGDADWQIDSVTVWEGRYSAVSGDIGDNQATSLLLDVSLPEPRPCRFAFKVSSEANYDGLEFYIDNTRYGPWQGDIDWQEMEVSVPAGDHTLKWRYVKDQGVTQGQDCAWVDFIVLPLSGASGFHCLPGDLNGDDQVSDLDVLRLTLILMHQGTPPSEEESFCGDVNYDSFLDVFDLLETCDRRNGP
ncbi:MAG: hypothetical protein D6762_07160 [Candidatus Neomarinimicrobiota bacterium]|nr:MAG: hypothetical protein D6762_07160 [Candidatus Neomarinimicrobiota bacterium]